MKSLAENFSIALCGLVTSVLVAILDIAIARTVGFDFFTMSVWMIIPVGAGMAGFAAASGYYFGSLYFHKRANMMLLLQMVVIAGFTQFLIYWLDYLTLVLDNGVHVSSFVSFTKYLDFSLTNAHYRVGRAQVDTGKVGSLGYWMAGLQFIGFLLGGLFIFFVLRAKLVCETCNLYLRSRGKKTRNFPSVEAASAYYDHLLEHPVDGEEFATLLQMETKKTKPKEGAVVINTELHACPKCNAQLIEESLQIFNGKEWKSMDDLARKILIPEGTDLAPIFQKKA